MARARRLREAALPVPKHITTINNLPDDCLFHIFTFLPLEDRFNSTAVCKRWRDFHSKSWRDLQKLDLISLEKLKHPSSFVGKRKPRHNGSYNEFGPIKRRRFNNWYGGYDRRRGRRYNGWYDDEYDDEDEEDDEDDEDDEDEGEDVNMPARFTRVYPHLLSLCGEFVKVLTIPVPSRFDIIRVAADNCHRLTKIRVRFENFVDKIGHSRDLARLFANNTATLRSVIIDNMQDFSKRAECLLQLPEKLIELQLWGYKARYARHVEGERTPFHRFIRVIQRLRNLQILVLNGLQISQRQLTMTIGNLHDLRYLEIIRSNPHPYSPFDIEVISSRRNLEYLSLQRLNNMNARWFADLIRNNPNLKHLKLQTCTLKPEFIVQLFALSKLETLSLTYLTLKPHLSGFYNLKKFVCTTAGDEAVIQLLEIATEIKLLNLRLSTVSPRVLDKAHQVTSNRTNNVPLHVIVESRVINGWQKPSRGSPLLTVESSEDWDQRTRCGYEGNEEELFY